MESEGSKVLYRMENASSREEALRVTVAKV